MPLNNAIKQSIATAVSGIFLIFLSAGVAASDVRTDLGFYGGVALRDRGAESVGLQTVVAPASWSRFATTSDDAATRALVYGGYRWRNDVAVEAALSSLDKYALNGLDAPTAARRGVGLGISPGALGTPELSVRTWNLDVYTSWAFYRSLALYGRLGYAQADPAASTVANLAGSGESRRLRDNVNYGVGLRYNMGADLGLRLEYGRFARFGVETGTPAPEADQVSIGVQYRF